ncbi:MAG: RNA methyltransferase, partial [Deltaproteobacteria bacterium]|nr:RNA methyltransferase [Deltaproteobacteria bacterium]
MGDKPSATSAAAPQSEVRCVHVEDCGACPLMTQRYAEQRAAKLQRLYGAIERYAIEPQVPLEPVPEAAAITGYRRRAKLVVARDRSGEIAVGLYRRHDNQHVVDIPHCQVLSPALMGLVAEIRELANEVPPELAALLEPAVDGQGVLTGLDARELHPPADDEVGEHEHPVLLTLILAAERAKPVDELREAARELRRRLPMISGLAVSLRYGSRQQTSSEFVSLSGATETKDALGSGYQLV